MGLEALLGPKVVEPAPHASGHAPSQLKLGQLKPGRYQPRTRMDEGSLAELAQSIRTQGLMQPVLVRPLGGGSYEIIAGERRVRAAGLAGLDEVPVLVRDVPDEAAAVMSLVENIQREDLNPLEEAQGLQRLIDEFRLTHDQAAQAVGRSRSAASNLMRLLNLTDAVQKLLMAGDLEMGHARALLSLDAAQQILCANEVVAKRLSVRDTERLVARRTEKNGAEARSTPAPAIEKSRDIARLEEQLADRLTAPVEIRLKRRGSHADRGEIAIAFRSLDELNGVLDKLGLVER
jgi:ParB family transcriptional regulator, chromosome partitioning protein